MACPPRQRLQCLTPMALNGAWGFPSPIGGAIAAQKNRPAPSKNARKVLLLINLFVYLYCKTNPNINPLNLTEMAKTAFFKNFTEFFGREDKSLNGTNDPHLVSDEDSTNRACWNCCSCKNCVGCIDCVACEDCKGCVRCVRCDNSGRCIDCSNCGSCNGCDNCKACVNCERCKDCECCSSVSYETAKERLTLSAVEQV